MYQINFKEPIHVYFMGIGGISMSGLAEILLHQNFRVSGSDKSKSALTISLEEKGACISYGQRSSNITDDIDLVVYTAAIHPDNPEFQEVILKQIPMLTRAALLGQIMQNYKVPIAVSGTHGKTTTTSMISEILLTADTDPTLSIGGIYKAIGGNIRVGNSDFFLTEACEYTNSFLSFFPKIAIILNVEEDHLDFFKDIHEIRNSFHNFAKLLPADGYLIINRDIEHFEELTNGLDCRVITYGTSRDSDYSFEAITFDEYARPSFTLLKKDGSQTALTLGVTGEHNVFNSLAAFALADLLEIDSSITQKALSQFAGTNRRFEYKGTLGGVTVLDDYAHHPTEIIATLSAAHNYPHKTIWCVFQPHTYTRTKAFLSEFADALTLADQIILTDIYAAREVNTSGITSKDLQDKLLAMGKNCHHFSSFDEIENFILENCINGDLLITMGAGDVVKIGETLLGL